MRIDTNVCATEYIILSININGIVVFVHICSGVVHRGNVTKYCSNTIAMNNMNNIATILSLYKNVNIDLCNQHKTHKILCTYM